MTNAKQRIAILGGGVGSIATAFELTNEPGWQERYEITLYQLGHRIGGKGASGRGPDGRIEEHGLHIWLGFYENAFRIIRQAYSELTPGGASPSAPEITDGVFSSWDRAFRKQSWVGVYEQDALGAYVPWLFRFPEDDSTPGDARAGDSLWSLIVRVAEWMLDAAKHGVASSIIANENRDAHGGLLADLQRLGADLQLGVDLAADSLGLATLQALVALLHRLPPDPLPGSSALRGELIALLTNLQGWVLHEIERHAPEERRWLMVFDLGAALVRGLIADEIFEGHKLASLEEEFRSWLRRHGARPETVSLEDDPLLRALYDFVFAFVDGNTSDLEASANFETGCAIRTIFRMLFTYRGAIFWKMNAGMGDTIFTPLYKLLARRGVRFEFFSKVEQLNLSPDGRFVESIEITQQATPIGGSYDPLVRVADLDCWPAQPKYAALAQGAELEKAGVNLESFWCPWPGVGKLVLRRGAQFDRVVFGLSLGSVPFVCSQIVATQPKWQAMVERVKTVRTMGVQLWMKPDLRGLGWQLPSAVTTAFAEPLDTWADMTHLLPREVWNGAQPGSLAYFCGALRGPEPDPRDMQTPARAQREVEAALAGLLPELRSLWPLAFDAQGRFDAQLILDRFLRANIDPSERYVLSVAQSSRHRLQADATGIENLFITGDWIDNGFNAGCVEAAVIAGMQAANAVLGRDRMHGVIACELL